MDDRESGKPQESKIKLGERELRIVAGIKNEEISIDGTDREGAEVPLYVLENILIKAGLEDKVVELRNERNQTEGNEDDYRVILVWLIEKCELLDPANIEQINPLTELGFEIKPDDSKERVEQAKKVASDVMGEMTSDGGRQKLTEWVKNPRKKPEVNDE